MMMMSVLFRAQGGEASTVATDTGVGEAEQARKKARLASAAAADL